MAIVNGYTTLAQLKATLRITDSVDDELLELAINAASRQIDGYCERTFYDMGTEVREFVPQDSFLTEIDDLISIEYLKTSSTGDTFDTTWEAADYQLEPLNSFVGGLSLPFTRIRAVDSKLFPVYDVKNVNAYDASVQVRGNWGFSAVPVPIEQATILYAARQYKRYDAPLGIAGFGDIGMMRIGRFDPDIEAMVSPYRRVRMA